MLDRLAITKPEQMCDPESLLEACWKLDASLQNWFRELNAIHAQPYVDRTGSSYPVPDFNAPLTADTEINHEYAQALSIYWMTCCFLYTTLRLVWEASDCPLYLLPQRVDPVRYAKLISESVLYFSAPGAGEASLVNYSICMGVALHVFSVTDQNNSLDAERLINVFDPRVASEDIGLRIGYFLRTLASSMGGVKVELESQVDEESMPELGKRWWGGGAATVTLRPRTPSSTPPKRADTRIMETPWKMLP